MTGVGVSYFGVRRVGHVARDMAEVAKLGATYVVHLMTEHDLDNYRTTMRDVVRVTREAGLQTWLDPVSIGHLFGGTEFPSELAMLRPELAQVDDTGRSLPAACPSHPEVRRVFTDWIEAAVDTGAETLFWDEPHLWIGSWYGRPERSSCYCDSCETRFEAANGAALPRDPRDPAAKAFRRGLLLDFLGELLAFARARDRRNAVTLLPAELDADASLSFGELANLGVVDDLGTDPYPFPSYPGQPNLGPDWRGFVGGYLERAVATATSRGIDSHLWVQGFSVPRADSGYLDGVFELAAESGVSSVAVWGFDGHRDMSRFACEDPDRAWAAVKRGVAAVRSRS